eukprot:COSAG02_NODE_605_length_19635_cov_7.106982_10_plen_81_part_00
MLALLIHMRSARAANRNHSSSVAQMADESNTYQLKQDACCVCKRIRLTVYIEIVRGLSPSTRFHAQEKVVLLLRQIPQTI